jgi:hypothetical protein
MPKQVIELLLALALIALVLGSMMLFAIWLFEGE